MTGPANHGTGSNRCPSGHDCAVRTTAADASAPAEPAPSTLPCAPQAKAAIRLNTYRVIFEAVRTGSAFAAMRAFKHTDAPTQEDIERVCFDEMMNALGEVIDWGDQ